MFLPSLEVFSLVLQEQSAVHGQSASYSPNVPHDACSKRSPGAQLKAQRKGLLKGFEPKCTPAEGCL